MSIDIFDTFNGQLKVKQVRLIVNCKDYYYVVDINL